MIQGNNTNGDRYEKNCMSDEIIQKGSGAVRFKHDFEVLVPKEKSKVKRPPERFHRV